MDIRNHVTVSTVIPAIGQSGPGALRDGVVTFLFKGGAKTLPSAAATIAGQARSVSVAPIDNYDVDRRPFLQAAILPN